MTPSEFTFLALGLVLGIASGAALIEVLRARPVSREVRVTVAPNAIHSRLAATLADPHGIGDPNGPARGGPGDPRWRDEIVATGEPAATGRRVKSEPAHGASGTRIGISGTPVPTTTRPVQPAAPARLAPRWPSQAGGATATSLVAVPMSLEPDPITTELRANAAASAVAALMTTTATAPDRPEASRSNGPSASTSPSRSRAPTATAEPPRPDDGRTAGEAGTPSAGADTPSTANGPCAEERRVADERCAVATRAREGAVEAAEAVRNAQRTYDDLVARAEAGAATTDPRAIRSAKELAQQQFRDARNRAGTRDDVEAGARAWLAEINRINQETREAAVGVERDRAAALALGPTVERLAVDADAARISAERADEACITARQAVADCDEARILELAAARSAGVAEPAADESAPGARDTDSAGRIAAAMPEPEDEFAFSTPMNSQAGQDALILQILRGDRDAMQRAVARLGGDDVDARRRWQTQLGVLAEALIARSIEATAFDFPIDHPFWGPFDRSQNRDIAAGLSSLGFRFDGFGGWVDERQPSQRDLSLAVGYAGLDPMRVRRWPNEAETRDLLLEVRVAADEYVVGSAGGLTLGELVTLLGRRADGLTELWNHWGEVRPILLEAN